MRSNFGNTVKWSAGEQVSLGTASSLTNKTREIRVRCIYHGYISDNEALQSEYDPDRGIKFFQHGGSCFPQPCSFCTVHMCRWKPRASCALVLWNEKDFIERLRKKGEKVPKDGMNSVSACLDKRWGMGSVCSLLAGKVNRLQAGRALGLCPSWMHTSVGLSSSTLSLRRCSNRMCTGVQAFPGPS